MAARRRWSGVGFSRKWVFSELSNGAMDQRVQHVIL
jgi:hypothetical protein